MFGNIKKQYKISIAFFIFCAMISLACAYGQNVNGRIVGTVTDSSNAGLPDAAVTVTDVNTSVARTFQTDSSGNYTVPDLPPGSYSVSAQKTGFAPAVHTGISLFAGSVQRVNVSLNPGTVAQSVSVNSEEIPALQTDTAETGRQIPTREIAELPLSTGRNFQSLLNTVPGAGVAVKDHSTFFNPQNSMASTVNGNSSLYNDFDIEGIDDNQRTNLLQIYIPPIEAIQQVAITTSNYDPQQGSALGAVTNVILKSGGNQFHGEVYYFYTGNALTARSYFQQGANGGAFQMPHAVDNYFGGNIGGPIQKGKTFFFVSFLEHTQHLGESYQLNVPTAALRGGDFRGPGLTPIYDPRTGDTADCLPGGNAKLCGTGRTQFPNNVIPSGRISSVAKALLAYVPPPNSGQNSTGSALYTHNLIANSVFVQTLPDLDVKIDRFFSNNDHVSGRFSFENPTLNQSGIFGDAGGPISGGGIGGAEGSGSDKTYSTGVNWVHTFSSTLLSEARFGVSRFNNVAFPTGYGKSLSEAAGIPGANVSQFTSGISTVSGEGMSDPMIGGCGNCPWTRAGTIIEGVENLTKIKGNHTFELGADYHRVRDDLLLVGNPTGAFAFAAGQTSLNGKGAPATGFANQFASFLLDTPNSVSRGYANTFPAYRQNQTFIYAGDKWQASPKLTVNIGLRWEYYGPPTPHETGGFSNYNPTNNTLELAGVGNVPRDLGVHKVWHNFGPRLGLSYRVTPNSVVRAGFGMSHMAFPIDLYAYNYPIEPTQQFSSLSGFGPAVLSDGTAASFAKGFPAITPFVRPANGIIQATGPLLSQSYFHVNTQWTNPYLESWNLAYERNLPAGWVVDIAYVGNKGVHTPIEYNENAATSYGQGAAGQPEFQAFGRTASTTEFFAGYSSNYNALQIKFDHKFSHGFSMTNSYTYSKALGFEGEASDYPNGLLDYVNQRRNYAPTDFNQTHIFNESFTWRLPFGKNQRFAPTGISSKVLGGWELAGVWETASGTPLNFSCTCSASFNTPGSQAFPDMSGPVKKLHGIQTKPWFDITKFSVPAAGTQGNVGNYISSGPRYFNLDASIFRRFPVTERVNLELRSEWLHATNTPQFGNPNTQLGSSNFGYVTSANGARVINIAGKLTF
ncbi:MAG: TonB-dependent receptor [Edaphobacter sp.]